MGTFDLTGKVIVITGGAGLLGLQFSRAIAAQGGRPVIADVREEEARAAAAKINEELREDRASAIYFDITSKNSISSALSVLKSEFGHIDALVNNAYPRNRNYGRLFAEVEYADFCENVNLHLGGYFLASQQFALYFKEQGHGNIITMASVYGVVAPRFGIYENTTMTMPVEYAVIKSALIQLNKYMMRCFQGSNIRFNCVSPGGILDRQPTSFVERYNAYAQTKGMLVPEDVGGALVFLLSDASRYINGQNLVIDDGWCI